MQKGKLGVPKKSKEGKGETAIHKKKEHISQEKRWAPHPEYGQ
ncbi:MAG: hypothetical protein ACQEU9_06745 [Bacillota bacterium]